MISGNASFLLIKKRKTKEDNRKIYAIFFSKLFNFIVLVSFILYLRTNSYIRIYHL